MWKSECVLTLPYTIKENDGNPHAHILLTMRPVNEDKTWGRNQKRIYPWWKWRKSKTQKRKLQNKKIDTVDWNEQEKAEEWRKAWADITNKYLEENSIQEKVNHRSYQRQGTQANTDHSFRIIINPNGRRKA